MAKKIYAGFMANGDVPEGAVVTGMVIMVDPDRLDEHERNWQRYKKEHGIGEPRCISTTGKSCIGQQSGSPH